MYGKKWKPIACKRKINILWQVNNIMQMETDVIIKLIYTTVCVVTLYLTPLLRPMQCFEIPYLGFMLNSILDIANFVNKNVNYTCKTVRRKL